MLWSAIRGKLDPFIYIESIIISYNAAIIDKIRKGGISWRTFYNNVQKNKLFEANKISRRRG